MKKEKRIPTKLMRERTESEQITPSNLTLGSVTVDVLWSTMANDHDKTDIILYMHRIAYHEIYAYYSIVINEFMFCCYSFSLEITL
jgi:hypothetical protein